MVLRSPSQIFDSPVYPFEVMVDLFRNGQNIGPGADRSIIADLQEISMGYGVDGHSARFGMWDPDTIDASKAPPGYQDSMPIPQQGDEVLIQTRDADQIITLSAFGVPQSIIFRGIIKEVASQSSPSGKKFIVSCVGMAMRLNESHVTMRANLYSDPFHPSPVFDPSSGDLVLASTNLRTVAELIKEVMLFRDAWGTTEKFVYSDIIWGVNTSNVSMELDPRCGAFVPKGVAFQNTPKGAAIAEVLERAGNYVLHYDPATGVNGKLHVIEINLNCNRCGPLWDLQFPQAISTQGNGEGYVHELDVVGDATTWSTGNSANMVRITSGPIRFYSGQHIIPEMLENRTKIDPQNPTHVIPATDVDRFAAVEQDTVANQKAAAVNHEGVFYRMQVPGGMFRDSRKFQQYPVGLPLFPDWNPHEDYLPEALTIVNAQAPSSGSLPTGVTPEQYKWETEYLQYTRGQATAMGISRLGRINNLRSYQAWHIKEVCPACHGSGNVAKVYSNPTNTPIVTWTEIGPPMTADGATTGTFKKVKTPTVTNYIMPANKFGDSTFDPVAAGLTPWVATSLQPYPVPWQNLCPYCRGVGFKPDYKIRNIEYVLVEGRSVPVTATTTVNEIPLDPEFTQTTPETWEQSQARVLLQSGPYIQMEYSINTTHRLPLDPAYKNYSWQQLSATTAAKSPFLFPHPLLGFKNTLITIAGISSTSPDANLVPSNWNSLLPFTTILFGDRIPQRPSVDFGTGRVLFGSPAVITAEMNWAMPLYNPNDTQKRSILQNNGLLKMEPTLNRLTPKTNIPIGYWRPARVWMQFFYHKDRYYYRPDSNDPEVTFNYVNADAVTKSYVAKAMIIDGAWTCEITRKKPSEWDPEELLGDRVVQAIVEDEESVIETTEEDLLLMLVPPSADLTPAQFEQAKRDAGCKFPRARMFKWDRPTPGEQQYEIEGILPASFDNALSRPRLYSWRLRDDRSRLMSIALRKLDEVNKVSVTGALTVKGRAHDVSDGLGWVDYPGRERASVHRVTHRFTNGWLIDLELSRQTARFGEMPPADKTSLSDLKNEFRDFRRRMEAGAAGMPPVHDQSQTNSTGEGDAS